MEISSRWITKNYELTHINDNITKDFIFKIKLFYYSFLDLLYFLLMILNKLTNPNFNFLNNHLFEYKIILILI